MNRWLGLRTACLWVAFVSPLLAADHDPIRAKLDKAKAAFGTEMEKFHSAVGDSLDKLEQTARKNGDKKLIDQVKAGRQALKDKGDLPESIPAAARSRLSHKLSLAQLSLETAYKTAIREYTKSQQDDEAATTEKELDDFKKGALVIAASGTDANVTLALQQWMKDVAALPAEKQAEAVAKKLVELNPGFDGKVTLKIENGFVSEFNLQTDVLTDISPLRALLNLKKLKLYGITKQNKLSNLSPLRGAQLTELKIGWTQVTDLSPLKGMPLSSLECLAFGVSDLSPLTNMQLTYLDCSGTQVSELTPLRGMPLTFLRCNNAPVSSLSPLEDCKSLRDVNVTGTKVTAEGVAALQKALPNCKIAWDRAATSATPKP